MNTLPLAPLPSETSKERRTHRHAGGEGFVDEQVVSSVIARGAYERIHVQPEGMVLSTSGDDYAGWVLPVVSPFRVMTKEPSASPTASRLPGSPTLRRDTEPGIDEAYQGGHRWWLFGMSGAMTCSIMALTIFSLAQRHDMTRMPPSPISAAESQKAPAVAEKKTVHQPALTSVLPAER
jgi:hypothetical protein